MNSKQSYKAELSDTDDPMHRGYAYGNEGLWMNGKLLVAGIVLFFLLFFVYESWMMRGLPHWSDHDALNTNPSH